MIEPSGCNYAKHTAGGPEPRQPNSVWIIDAYRSINCEEEGGVGKERVSSNLPVPGVFDFEGAGCFDCFADFFGCCGACLSALKKDPSVYTLVPVLFAVMS